MADEDNVVVLRGFEVIEAEEGAEQPEGETGEAPTEGGEAAGAAEGAEAPAEVAEEAPLEEIAEVPEEAPQAEEGVGDDLEKSMWDDIPPVSKVQVDPGATIEEDDEHPLFTSSLPVVPEIPMAYKPCYYTFRVKDKGQRILNRVKAKAPPFHLQLDLTIPVIWSLFNSDSEHDDLGVSQLQWALYFLKAIICSEGAHPADVQLCIDAVQDCLIDKYADMSQESVVYGSTHIGDFAPPKKIPDFSVNYSQMTRQCSDKLMAKESGLLDAEFLRELENIKNIVGISSIDVTDSVSRDKALNILQDWRKEQVDKIQCEMNILFTVEDMLKNVDEDNFSETQLDTLFQRYEK